MPAALILLAGPAGFAAAALIGLTGFDLLRRRALVARRVVAGAAAAGALLAPASPTGLDVWDAVLRAALAAGFVLLAVRSRPVWWVPGAVVATVAMAGAGPLLAAAGALLGATVAFATSARRLPLAGAVVGALLVQLALRLEWPQATGSTAAMAFLALAPMAASGLRHSPRAVRRAGMWAGVAAGVATGLGGLAGLGAGLLARGDFLAGARSLEAGVAAVRGGDETGTANALSSAIGSFGEARDTLDSTWLLPARLVPIVAQHVAALQEAARTGGELAFTGAETVASSDLAALRVADGRVDLDQVRSLRDPLARAVAGLDDAHRRLVHAAGSRWLVTPLADRLDREIARIERSRREATTVLATTRLLPSLLGGDGPRRYFLAIQTPAELRGSGGIIGAFGEVTADAGSLAVGAFGRDADLNTRGTPAAERTLVGPADYVARYGAFHPEAFWQNVPVSPHFPAVGEVIAGLYPQSGGAAVDGVISVDPTALAAMLTLVGPITVPPWPEPLTAANAERILLFEQYVRLEGTARTDFLGDVAEVVAQRLTTGTPASPAALVAALAPAVRSHHLQLWSRVPAEQALFRRIGADGGLAPEGSDSLAVVNVNAAGNKVDWFLRRRSDYRARVDTGTGRVTATLTISLHNEAPAGGLPAYVIGSARPAPADPSGTNRTSVSVYSPLFLTAAQLDGQPAPVGSGREVGRNVYSLTVVIPPGATRTIVLDLAGRVPAARGYQLRWKAQPLAVPETVSARITSAEGVVVVRRAGPMAGDETLTASRGPSG